MTTSNLKCPKCGSKSLTRNKATQGLVCMNCGKEIKGTHEVHLFIQANGKEIAKDYSKMTLDELLHKWGISLKALYNIPGVIEIKANNPKHRGRPHLIELGVDNRHNGHLPKLPPFSSLVKEPGVQLNRKLHSRQRVSRRPPKRAVWMVAKCLGLIS